jgi:UDP-N-acetylmuramoyl-L-alanyl-D-glutamate--2,6-diaminopimelate ligase
MKLGALFPDVTADLADLTCEALTADSRKASPDTVFIAVPGNKADGRTYIADAVSRGVRVVVAEGPRPADLPASVSYHAVRDARFVLAKAAARLYPDTPAHIVAVTGTSGKSSVAEFVRQIFASLGHEAASLGTLGITRAGHTSYGQLTTPDPVSLHHILSDLAHEGVTHLSMEASSHGLDQRRLDGVWLKAAGFTNLGHDHLDYHHDLEHYFQAKLRLFSEVLPEGGAAVVHMGSIFADRVVEVARQRKLRVLTVGERGDDLKLLDRQAEGFDQRITLMHNGVPYPLRIPLAGAFQVDNALVAAGLVLSFGEAPTKVLTALEHIHGVRGRLERVPSPQGSLIVIDYAHKPDGLRAVLETLRKTASGRVMCVFGCGGDRYTAKRPEMGAIAARLADLVIVTDDNPRSEDPALIRRAILAKVPGALEIPDRGEAIAHAVALLRHGDVLLVAGKGHETGQIIGDVTRPFSDHEAVAAAMQELAG